MVGEEVTGQRAPFHPAPLQNAPPRRFEAEARIYPAVCMEIDFSTIGRFKTIPLNAFF